jgi:hypothetical protein
MGAPSVQNWSMTVTSTGVDGVTFVANKVDKQYPKAGWGSKFSPNIGEEGTTLSILSGVQVLATPGKPPGFTEAVDADEFKFTDVVENYPYWQWGTALNRVSNSDASQNVQTINDTLTTPQVVERRNTIATFFDALPDPSADTGQTIDVSQTQQNLDAAFIGTPTTIAA